jgi:hypothetical protein
MSSSYIIKKDKSEFNVFDHPFRYPHISYLLSMNTVIFKKDIYILDKKIEKENLCFFCYIQHNNTNIKLHSWRHTKCTCPRNIKEDENFKYLQENIICYVYKNIIHINNNYFVQNQEYKEELSQKLQTIISILSKECIPSYDRVDDYIMNEYIICKSGDIFEMFNDIFTVHISDIFNTGNFEDREKINDIIKIQFSTSTKLSMQESLINSIGKDCINIISEYLFFDINLIVVQ